jgi:hypothetical protein
VNTKAKTLPNPLEGLIRDAYYEVPPEQRERFLRLTPIQRLRWLDEARRFTMMVHASNPRKQQ